MPVRTLDWLTHTSSPVKVSTDVRQFATAHLATAEVILAASDGLSIDEISSRVAAKLSIDVTVARAHTDETLRALLKLPGRN